jgi:hypothetical protein
MPNWVKAAIEEWALLARINSGPLLRAIHKTGRAWGNGFTPKVIWSFVKEGAANRGLWWALLHMTCAAMPNAGLCRICR